MTTQEQALVAQLAKSKTRSGVAFKATAFQKDLNGNIAMIAGTVTEANEKAEMVEREMLWNINGYCTTSSVPMKYDLIVEEVIDYSNGTNAEPPQGQ